MKLLIAVFYILLSSFALASQNPIAKISVLPETGYLPLMVNLSAAGSSDPDGTIVSYVWSFGDGTSGEGQEVSHYYSLKKVENIKLTVTDNSGKKGTANFVYKFLVDRISPELTFDVPENFTVRTNTPIITAFYSDSTSKVDISKTRFILNDVDVTSRTMISDNHAVLQFTSDWPLVPGNHVLNVRISDYYGNTTSKRLTFSYESDVITKNFLNGQVFDGEGLPLANAEIVSISGPTKIQLNGITDINGKFSIPFTVGGEYILRIQKFGYLETTRTKAIIQGLDDVLEKIYLTEADTKTTLITAMTGGVASNTSGSISLLIPQGSLSADTQFSLTEAKTGRTLRVPLPNGSQFTYAQSVFSNAVSFSQPATMTIDNVLGFPAGYEIPYGTTSNGLGIWVDSGVRSKVSEDGTKINTPITNFSLMAETVDEGDTNAPVGGGPGENPDAPGPEETDDDNPFPPEQCSSRINASTCNLSIDYAFPDIKRRGKSVGLQISYSSLSANPKNIIQVRNSSLNEVTPPTNLRQIISWGGHTNEITHSGESAVKASALGQFYNPINSQGQFLQTGSIIHRTELSSRYDNMVYASTPYFGGPPGEPTTVISREPVYLQEYVYGRSTINNQRNSIFGAGWELNGWEKLYKNADGAITLTDGDGLTRNFIPLAKKVGRTVIQKNIGGEISNLYYHKGFVYGADCSSNQVFRIDAKGRLTTMFGGINKRKADLNCPTSIHPSRRGGHYIADSGNGRILYADSVGKIKVLAGGDKNPIGNPTFVTEDNVLAVHFIDGDEVKTISPFNGEVLTMVGMGADALFKYDLKKPTQIHYDEYFNLIVLDEGSGKIIKFYVNSGKSRVMFDKVKGIKALAYDTILKRFFLLDKNGQVHHWNGWGSKKTHLLDVGGNSPKIFYKSSGKTLRNSNVSAIAFSPELGLITANDIGLKMGTINNDSKSSTQDIFYVPSIADFSELTQKTDGSFVRTLVDKTVITYNSKGFITERRGSNGAVSSYEYDTAGKLVKIYLPDNGFYILQYDGRGYVKSIIDPANRSINLTIDQRGDLASIEDPLLLRKEYTYDSDHLLITKQDERGLVSSYQYILGRIKSALYPGDRFREISHSIVTLVSRPPEAEVPRLPANKVGSSFTSPEGRTKTILLDNYGTNKGSINGEGNTNYVERNEDSLPTEMTSAEGRKERKMFDDLGRISKSIDANGLIEYSYDTTTQKISSMKDAKNFTSYLQYNTQGLLERTINKKGKSRLFGYNASGSLVSITDPINNVSSLERDSNGNIISSTDPLGNQTNMSRDEAGNMISSSDPSGHTTILEYDSANRMTKLTDAKGGITSFEYLPTGEIESLIDARNKKTQFIYNDQAKVVKTINPLNLEENMSYDLDNNLILKTNKKGQSISFNYNGNNKIVTKSFPGDSLNFNYDRDDLLISMSDSDSEVRMEYDALKRISAETSNHYDGHIEYAYNQRGEKVGTKFFLNGADGIDLNRQFDANGNLTLLSGYYFGKKVDFERTLDDADRATVIKLPNGSVTNYSFDKNSRISSQITWFKTQSHYMGYKYTANGNISSIYDEFNALPRVNRFEYDDLSRLVKEDSLKSVSYNLDPVGNNLSSGGEFNELNQLISNNEHLFEYDLNGNLTKKTFKLSAAKLEYSWTAENQLTSVRVFNKNGILSHTITHNYDGTGRRIVRSVQNHLEPLKSYARRYIYDGNHILALLDGENNFVAGYIYGPGIDDPMGVVTDYNQDGELDVLSFIKDRQNSVRIILNENQDVVQEIFYSAYGETQIVNRGQIKQNLNNIFYYTSRELEPETGDYYYRARYYDPALGRFLSEDPIGFIGGDINLYRYVFNNPLLYTDASGHFPNPVPGLTNPGGDAGAVGAIIGGGLGGAAGSVVAPGAGTYVGGFLGAQAGGAIGSYFGGGNGLDPNADYNPPAPNLPPYSGGNGIPQLDPLPPYIPPGDPVISPPGWTPPEPTSCPRRRR